eukprot:610983-Rhodomonas_salina.2
MVRGPGPDTTGPLAGSMAVTTGSGRSSKRRGVTPVRPSTETEALSLVSASPTSASSCAEVTHESSSCETRVTLSHA